MPGHFPVMLAATEFNIFDETSGQFQRQLPKPETTA